MEGESPILIIFAKGSTIDVWPAPTQETNTCTRHQWQHDVYDVVLMSLLLIWTCFTLFSSVFIVKFEEVNVCWVNTPLQTNHKT